MPFDISIIIPALNESQGIARAVERAWATKPAEVLVIDGGSLDGTSEIAAACGARTWHSQRGRAHQQNLGAEKAVGETLLFLHADNWLAAEGLHQISRALIDPTVQCGAFRQRIEAPAAIYRAIECGNAFRARHRGLPYGDQGIFVRRGVLEAVGGFPDVDLMEDLLLMRRLRRFSKPILLPGPILVNARRWQQQGVLRQTLVNWALLTAERLGTSPKSLARFYPSHSNGRADD